MGASHSGHPRTVNMENPTPIGVIDVSDEVVQRLKIGLAKSKDEQAKQVAPPAPVQVPTTAKIPNPYPLPPQHQYQHQQHPTVLYSEPSITAIEVRRQKELELQQNDLYWRKRLAQLEQTLNKTNTIMEKEYSQAINDVRKSFINAPAIHQLPPCQDIKANLIACYRTNPNESLKCSEEVLAFMNCVSENRVKKLDGNVNETKSSPQMARKLENVTNNNNNVTSSPPPPKAA